MPIQLHDLDYWSEDVKPSFIDDLEFYCGSPAAQGPTPSAMTVAAPSAAPDAAAPAASDLWKTFEPDEELFMSMSPPNTLTFDEISFVDFDEDDGHASDPLVSASVFGSGVLFHDCMWAGHCAGSEHETDARPSKGPSSACGGESASLLTGSGSAAIGVVSGCCKGGSEIYSCAERTAKTIPPSLQSVASCSSTTPTTPSASCSSSSSGNSSHSSNAVRSLSNGCSSSSSSSSTSVVKTIEVPVVSGGPVRRTGVIVQKTFGRSLLIKSRTKCENNKQPSVTSSSANSNCSSSGNSLLKVKSVDPIISQAIASNNNNHVINNSSYINNNSSVQTASPVPFVPAAAPTPVVVSGSRPETPQSLSESEDDSCQLDLVSVLYNLDNLKPPQGDLWDDVLAAVEQEQASGIEIPPVPGADNEPADDLAIKIESVFALPKEEPFDDVPVKVESVFVVPKEEPFDDVPVKVESVFVVPKEEEVDLDDDEDEEDEDDDEDDDEEDEDDDLSDSSVRLDSGVDDLPPSPVTTNSSPVKEFPNGNPSGFSRNAIAAATTVVSDHTYDKRAWIRLDDLGVQTPSDSEEEVDVVSLYKQESRSVSRSSSRSSDSSSPGLPTNPSAKDQEELQEITASKLLSASRAVSKRLRTKASRGKTYLKSGGKRRLSDDDEALSKRARVHLYRPTKSRFATDSESDSKEKRDMHNNMERMRRIDLRNSFEELKALVPSLANKERAPKVLILQDAAGYCTDLKIQSRQLGVQVAALRKEQERLRATVSGLRRSLAAHR